MPDLWPYIPDPAISETLAWNTQVSQTETVEFRTRLRKATQSVMYNYTGRNFFQGIAAKFAAAPYGDWLVPLWHQFSRVASIGSSDTTLTVDLDADWTTQAVIWKSCTDFLVVTIDSITSTLNLSEAVGRSFTNAIVMPVRLCYCIDGVQTQRFTKAHTSLSVTFTAYDLFSPSGASLPSIGSYAYFPCSGPYVKPVRGYIRQDAELVDSGFGAVAVQELREVVERRLEIAVAYRTEAAKQEFRRFLGDMRGRDGLFYVADWDGAMSLASSLSIGATTATVTGVMPAADYVGRWVKFGAQARQITAATDLSGGDVQLTFAALTAAATEARLLRRVRMDGDQITLAHQRGFVTEATFGVYEA